MRAQGRVQVDEEEVKDDAGLIVPSAAINFMELRVSVLKLSVVEHAGKNVEALYSDSKEC